MFVILVLSWNTSLPDSTLQYLSEVLRNAWDGRVLVHLLVLGSYVHQSTLPFYAMLRICSISQTNIQIWFTYIPFRTKLPEVKIAHGYLSSYKTNDIKWSFPNLYFNWWLFVYHNQYKFKSNIIYKHKSWLGV